MKYLKVARMERLSVEQMYLMIALIETPDALIHPSFAGLSDVEKAHKIAKWIRRDEETFIKYGGERGEDPIFARPPELSKQIQIVRERYENTRID